jgi:hypothetical protein
MIHFQRSMARLSAIVLTAVLVAGFSACKTQHTVSTSATSAAQSIESPQPQLINQEAAAWAKAHAAALVDKYLKDAGNKLDPDEMRKLFTPIGYDGGSNTIYYRDAEKVLVDTLYGVMLQRAVAAGKTSIVIFTGPSASGKSTATKTMDFSDKGIVYDAAFNSYRKLSAAVQRAQQAGMKQVTVIAVYNTIRNCFRNSLDRGKVTNRFIHVPYMIESYRNNINKMELMRQNFPDVEYICIDKSDNVHANRVTMDDAVKWNFSVSQEEIHDLFSYIIDEINKGELTPHQLAYVTGDILSIEGLSDSNKALAQEIDRRIREMSR